MKKIDYATYFGSKKDAEYVVDNAEIYEDEVVAAATAYLASE